MKKKQVQVVDRQIEHVDETVARDSKDLMLTSSTVVYVEWWWCPKTSCFREDIPIETMSDSITEFTPRCLRASNMHTSALRLAGLWGMQYDHDPLEMMVETKK